MIVACCNSYHPLDALNWCCDIRYLTFRQLV
jgi:hypothetical protein